MADLTLKQRALVSREISKEYRKWTRKKGEPSEAERKQITAIGFSMARRRDRSIPAANPIALGEKLISDIVGGLGFGLGAGLLERYIMRKNTKKNPRSGHPVVTTPSKLEAEKICSWVGREGIACWIDVHENKWAVMVSGHVYGKARKMVKQVLATNPKGNGPKFAVLDPMGTIVYTKAATGTGDVALKAAHAKARQLAHRYGRTYYVWLALGQKVGDSMNLALLSDAVAVGETPEHNPESVDENPRRPRRDPVDALIEQAYYRHGHGIQISILDIPKVFKDVKLEMASGVDLDTSVQNAIARYRVNPNENPLTEHEKHLLHLKAEAWNREAYHTKFPGSRRYFEGRATEAEDVAAWGGAQPNPLLMTVLGANPKRKRRRRRNAGAVTRRLKKNPKGSGRKITMSIEKFWRLLQKKGDQRLIADFRKKFAGYKKWTHGTAPRKVTLEAKNVPGMSGLWLTYDMGTQPESTYVMPKGTKRKGAWKHPWERSPKLKGDPESGLILTQLVPGNRLTDFMHG